jgi:hypothetical protein
VLWIVEKTRTHIDGIRVDHVPAIRNWQSKVSPTWTGDQPKERLTAVIHYIRKKTCLWTAKGISTPVEDNKHCEIKDYDHSYMHELNAIKGAGDSPTTWIPVRLREFT